MNTQGKEMINTTLLKKMVTDTQFIKQVALMVENENLCTKEEWDYKNEDGVHVNRVCILSTIAIKVISANA